MSSLKLGLAAALFAGAAGLANAQTMQAETVTPEPVREPIRLGSVNVYPSLSLRDVGVDSNIYNAAGGRREDFTYTVAPRVMTELPIGDARLVGTGGLGFVFFRTSKDQESVNSSASGLFDVREGRVRPSLQAGYSRSRQRRGDIDVRALTVATNGRAGVDVTVSGVTSLTAWVVREKTEYASGEMFFGQDLGDQLDRKSTTFAAGARLDLTPFTSVVTAAELEQVRFTVARTRDADSYKFLPTVRFAEGAIVTGSAFAGLRDFRPLSGAMPSFRGFVAGGDIRFTIAQVSRFELRGNRDIVYSYDNFQPYYMDSGGQVTLAQRVIGPVEAIALAGRRRFRYQTLRNVVMPGRIETMSLWGGGIGVRVDDHMRLTFTLDRERRVSTQSAQRQFERIRAFASLEYLP
jgi:hypothetical protein